MRVVELPFETWRGIIACMGGERKARISASVPARPVAHISANAKRISMKTIQELREERGESQQQVADALGLTLSIVADWEAGEAEPSIRQLRLLTEHFDVRNDQIDLRPGHTPSFGDRIEDLF